MIGIDWSHTKGLAVADGEKTIVISSVDSLPKDGTIALGSNPPLTLIYELLRSGHEVVLVDDKQVKAEREKSGVGKSDQVDAEFIRLVALNGDYRQVNRDEQNIQLLHTYSRFLKNQKARVALTNMAKGHLRYFGSWTVPGDELIFELCTKQLKLAEDSCLQELKRLSPPIPSGLNNIKGLGPRIWGGIMSVANPRTFPHIHQYLKYCGLTASARIDHKYSRRARVVYYLFADQIIRQKDALKTIYDEAKQVAHIRHENGGCNCKYPKAHCHNIGTNRLATELAKMVYKSKNDW